MSFENKSAGFSRQQLSHEEWVAKKKEERDLIYKMADEASTGIVSSPLMLKGYLDTQSRFNLYSTTNALLIYHQKPEATQIKTFDGWAQEDVQVSKGEKSILILDPTQYTRADGSTGTAYNVKKVFDISQTDAPRKPAPTYTPQPLSLAKLLVNTAPVKVVSADSTPVPNSGAYYDNNMQILFVRKNSGNETALFNSILLETAHAQLSIISDMYNRKAMGFPAACVAYMIARKFGMDANVFNINGIPEEWKSMPPKEIRKQLNTIRSAMALIFNRLSKELYAPRQDHPDRDSR